MILHAGPLPSVTNYHQWSDLKQYQFLLLECWNFSSVQSLSRVGLFVTPWTAARQASLSITKDWGTQSFFPNFMKINIIRIQNISSSKDRKGSPEEIHSLGNFCKTHSDRGLISRIYR